MSDMVFIYRWGVEDVSNEGQVKGLKGSRGEKRLIPADWPLEPLCCRERRKGREEWRETRYSEKKTQMEGGGTSSRMNREQTYGPSRTTEKDGLEGEKRGKGCKCRQRDGGWSVSTAQTGNSSSFFFMMQLFFSSIHTASSGLSALRGCCAAPW